MKIAIFGATGKVGRHLLDQALERGDEVTVFVRETSKLTTQRHERLKVAQGDVLDPKDVERTVVGTGAVLSALGHAKMSSKDVLTEGTKNIVAAMNKHGVRRLVSLTGSWASILDSYGPAPTPTGLWSNYGSGRDNRWWHRRTSMSDERMARELRAGLELGDESASARPSSCASERW